MSLNINKLEVVNVLDPIVDIDQKPKVACFTTGNFVSYKRISTESFSNSGFTLNAPNVSPSTFIDRKVVLEQPITISGNKMHSPAHDGCECSIVAG